jgi:hypothetical protein
VRGVRHAIQDEKLIHSDAGFLPVRCTQAGGLSAPMHPLPGASHPRYLSSAATR